MIRCCYFGLYPCVETIVKFVLAIVYAGVPILNLVATRLDLMSGCFLAEPDLIPNHKRSSKHTKGAKECYLLGQDTTYKFLG